MPIAQRSTNGSVFGRVNSLEHLAGCAKDKDIEIFEHRYSNRLIGGGGGWESPAYVTVTEYQAVMCESCQGFTISYRSRHKTGSSLVQVPAVFECSSNVVSHETFGPMAEDLVGVVRDAFGDPGFDREDALAHLKGKTFLTAHQGEKVVGFGAVEIGSPREIIGREDFPDESGIYISAAAVSQEAQGQGIYKAMMLFALYSYRAGYNLVFMRTQNPRMEGVLRSGLRVMRAAGDIGGYSLSRIKLPGYYGKMLTGERQTSSNPEIQGAYDLLDTRAGDAYVLVAKMEKGGGSR